MPQFVPVSVERHGTMAWQRFRSYAFVQDHPLVPIVLGEHEQVAATLPIVLAPVAGGLGPVAVTRLGARTALVGPNGAWRGLYVPSLLRVHPFSARPADGAAGSMTLLVDEGSGLVASEGDTGAGWERFFDHGDQLSAAIREIVAFFAERGAAEARTRAAVQALVAARILTEAPPITLPPDHGAWPEGIRFVDPEALTNLSRVALGALHRSGGLALAHAMLVSRHHLGFLAQIEAAQIAAATHPRPPTAQPVARQNEALSGFLDALAAAQKQG